MNAKHNGSRPAKEGEMCACGKPAKQVLIRELGEVPTCCPSKDYARSLKHVGQVARETIARLAQQQRL